MSKGYLVTGGAGFIGSNLVHRLVGLGERVRVFDNLSSGHLENLQGLETAVEFVQGDLRDAGAVREAMWGMSMDVANEKLKVQGSTGQANMKAMPMPP